METLYFLTFIAIEYIFPVIEAVALGIGFLLLVWWLTRDFPLSLKGIVTAILVILGVLYLISLGA